MRQMLLKAKKKSKLITKQRVLVRRKLSRNPPKLLKMNRFKRLRHKNQL